VPHLPEGSRLRIHPIRRALTTQSGAGQPVSLRLSISALDLVPLVESDTSISALRNAAKLHPIRVVGHFFGFGLRGAEGRA
jgi:hypothetical protein